MQHPLNGTDFDTTLTVPQQLFDFLLNKTLLHLGAMLDHSESLEEVLADSLAFFKETLFSECAEIHFYLQGRQTLCLHEGATCDESCPPDPTTLPDQLHIAWHNNNVIETFPIYLNDISGHVVLIAHGVDQHLYTAVKAVLAEMASLVEKVIQEKHQLHQLRRTYEAISGHALFMRVTAECRIDLISQALAKRLQLTSAVIGQPLTDVFGGENAALLCQSGTDPVTFQYTCHEKALWLRATRMTIQNEMGDSYHFFLFDDISQQVEAEEQALHDPLTGLYNRILFNEIIERALRHNQRQHRYTAFVMLDLDHFKQLNDSLGHQAGDATLKAFAKALSKTFARPHDFLFRLGGEEFALLFSAVSIQEIESQLQRLYTQFEEHPLPPPANPPWARMTFSAGVVAVPPTCAAKTDGDALYQYADKLLYAAKQAGRNTYRLATLNCERPAQS